MYGKTLTPREMPNTRAVRSSHDRVLVFSKKAIDRPSTWAARLTLRVLYNVNTIDNRKRLYSKGDQVHYWRDEKLFIFDGTRCNTSRATIGKVRYCMSSTSSPESVPRRGQRAAGAIRMV